MSRRRAREKRRQARTLALLPQPAAGAGADVQLALRLRNEANLTGRCPCGATVEVVTIRDGVHVGTFHHEHDCPASTPVLQQALARGEIGDPAGDPLRAFRDERA